MEARGVGGAILADPVVDTIKRAATGAEAALIAEEVPREGLWRAQTPQVFRGDFLVEAHRGEPESTDDASLVTACGHPVRLVAAPTPNFKVTRPADLYLAEAVLRARNS